MFKVTDKIQIVDISPKTVYQNFSLIIFYKNCNYICILDNNFDIIQSYIHIGNYSVNPFKLQKLVFTNNNQLWNAFNKNRQPKEFKSIQQYSEWLLSFSKELKIINFYCTNLLMDFSLDSKSELKNLESIHVWWYSKKDLLHNMLNGSLIIYNLYNYILFLLSKNQPGKISSVQWWKYFRQKLPNQLLYINIESNRAKSDSKHINYYNISPKQQKWKYIKPSPGKMFYKIDYCYSYINLLFKILDIYIQGDPYNYLAEKMELKGFFRQEIKNTIFKILFSNEIKKYTNIDIFKKIYNFSLLLEQDYKKQGYIQSLISEKRIKFENGEKFSRAKLLNKFVMSLESEIYIGILYQLLLFPKEKIKPVFFIFDAIILQIDIQKSINQIQYLEKILTLNGLFPIKRFLGKNLYKWEKI